MVQVSMMLEILSIIGNHGPFGRCEVSLAGPGLSCGVRCAQGHVCVCVFVFIVFPHT